MMIEGDIRDRKFQLLVLAQQHLMDKVMFGSKDESLPDHWVKITEGELVMGKIAFVEFQDYLIQINSRN